MLSEKSKEQNVYLIWAAIFIPTVFLSFLYFLIPGKTFVIAGDGITQHLTALTYYGEMLREYIKNIFASHFKDFTFPQWDLNLGLGSDIITTLHYYVIGEPITLLSVFVPKEHTKELYSLLIVLRIFLCGLTFLVYCRHHDFENLHALIGATIYSFCGFTFYCAVRHPYFITPMIYLPLLLLGVDKILERRGFLLFAASVFLSCISNFYFFYMLSVAVFLYAVVRFFCAFPKSEWKTIFSYILPCLLAYLLGIFMAAVIFFPQVYGFIFSARNEESEYFETFYRPMYYIKSMLSVVAPPTFGSYSTLGYAAPALPLVLLSLSQSGKKSLQLRIFFSIGLVILVFPALAYFLNGFKAVTNRWAFTLSFPVAIAAIEGIKLIREQKSKYWSKILLFCIAFSILVILASLKVAKLRNEFLVSYVILLLVSFSLFFMHKKGRFSVQAVLFLTVLSVIVNANVRYAPWGLDYLSRFLGKDQLASLIAESDISFNDGDENLYRIETANVFKNKNFHSLTNINGSTYYWAMNNQSLVEMYNTLIMSAGTAMVSDGFENEPVLSALFNIKYDFEKAGAKPPYGFEESPLPDQKGFSVLKNSFFVPFGFTYDKTISESDFAKLPPLEKRAVLLNHALVQESLANELLFEKYESGQKIFSKKHDFTLVSGNESVISRNEISIPKKESFVKIEMEDKGDLHYLYIKNLAFATDIHSGTSLTVRNGGRTKVFEINGDGDTTGHNFLIYLGESESAELSFGNTGLYSFEEMALYSLPSEYVEAELSNLKKDAFKKTRVSKNKIYGEIALEKNKIACLSIPYSKHWSAKIDGKSAEIFMVQCGLTGLYLEKGEHTIELTYKTPLFFASFVISLIAWVLFITLYVFSKSISNSVCVITIQSCLGFKRAK